MWGAAPHFRRVAALFVVGFAAAALPSVALARPDGGSSTTLQVRASASPARLPAVIWGVEVGRSDAKSFNRRLALRLRRNGVNTVVIDPARVPAKRRSHVRRVASGARLYVVSPLRVSKGERPAALCAKIAKANRRSACALMAGSRRVALRYLKIRAVDLVVVRVKDPRAVQRWRRTVQGRLLALVELRPVSGNSRRHWQSAIWSALSASSLDLAVAPLGKSKNKALTSFLRLLAPSAQGVAVAADTTAPTAPSAVTALDVTESRITLGWRSSSDNDPSLTYVIYVDGVEVGQAVVLAAPISDLKCGTSYVIQVQAVDDAGNRSPKTSIQKATRPCPPGGGGGGGKKDTTAPAAPSGLVQTSSTQTSIALSWNAATDDVGVEGYGLYRSGAYAGASAAPGTTFTGLSCGTTYSLAVDAYDAAGNRSAKVSLNGTTAACSNPPSTDVLPPSTPLGLTSTGATVNSLSALWTASTDDVGVAGYGLYRDGYLVATTNLLAYTFLGLACGTTYTLSVDAFDAAGNRSSRASLSAQTAACATSDVTPPSVPQGQALLGITQTSVEMVWTASTDDVGVAGYYLYRNDVRVGSTQSLSYTFAGLSCGTTYLFGLEAYDAAGNVSNRDQAEGSASTAACSADTQSPSAPQGLAFVSTSQTSVSVAWLASSDDVGVAGYRVYRDGGLVGSTASLSLTVGGLSCGTAYTFGVEAFDGAGNTSSRTTGSSSTSACSPPPPGSSSANLWVDSNGGTCTRAATPAAYLDAAACASFDAAYDRAACGDVVRVRGGTYPDQTTTGQRACGGSWDGTSCELCVRFLEAEGERVVVGDLTGNSDYVEFVGFESLQDWNVTAGDVDHVICRDCDVYGVFYSGPGLVQHVSMIGGDVGPMVNGHPQLAVSNFSGQPRMLDILFQGVTFHDVTCTDCAAYHVECMQAVGGQRVTFRANLWFNCGIFGLSLTEYNQTGPPIDYVVENNFFGPSINGGAYSFHVNSNASKIVRLVLQYNSSPQQFAIDNVVPLENAVIRGNLAPRPSCSPPGSFTFDSNVWLGGACSASDLGVSSLGFVNAGAHDYHITSTSPARGRGGTICPIADYDGHSRSLPSGTRCDAGADERD